MIKITFPNSRGDRLYFPEETISGQATWDPKYEHKKAEIRLFWYTQGKGDVDIQIIDKIEIPNPSEGKAFFKFNLPKEPYSFSGKLISLIWAIELVFFPSKESFKADFAMSPSGQEIDLYQKPTLKDS